MTSGFSFVLRGRHEVIAHRSKPGKELSDCISQRVVVVLAVLLQRRDPSDPRPRRKVVDRCSGEIPIVAG